MLSIIEPCSQLKEGSRLELPFWLAEMMVAE